MPKCMHDTSMDRGFGDEYIGINSAQLQYYEWHGLHHRKTQRNIDFPVRGLILYFSGHRSRYVA